MASLNRVILAGNLTRDPEVRYLPSGAPVADLGLAVSRKYRTQQGEEREDVCFVNVTAWGKTAENCGQYLSKGSPILIEGRLKFDQWEKEGQKQSRLTVVAESVQFLSSGRRSEGRAESSAEEYGDAPARDNRAAAPSSARDTDDAPTGDDDDLPF
jgi:single-strand DNA-binding protein